MKLTLVCIAKTDEDYLKKGISIYEKRLQHYISFELIEIPALKDIKNLSPEQIKEKEAELLQKYLSKSDYIVLLDERGTEFRSMDFADFMQKKMNQGCKNLTFIIGGAFGFSPKIYALAHEKVAFSKMTFSHQMIRLFFVEQCYRAFSILKNEPYHNE